ncbi:nitrogenase cofactor biosynthesis protein NifB [Seleniivibrio woodruffii]|uniref:FeMo cofactor biosynthesis protein NifB n=1 Tax=Seleniivibrio woodruffii TaxID=1078050 RepID=A0A4R1KE41_9BACT|nr:nitrogenase cofactor biosynthesis protein NifB [Seleniivibrio woodruffii]TCK62263.1 nitrogen fixation protein NifB [Seleniivibrio woodruffii]TVZ34619.1 nitrogen fixation protein NifB [Seleniivibrio woodruffii]
MDRDTVKAKIDKHPCFCKDAHNKFARIHLPVAPACNIQCNYCNRKYDCSNESRPGVTSAILTPEHALEKVIMVKHSLKNLSVVGIAGPGDALANPEATFETLRLLKTYDRELIPCISTNGLALPDHLDEIAELKIGHVTVTMNAVDPDIGQKIYSWIHYNDRTYHGAEAARILMERQIEGIKGLVERGILVKINTVLIPGINENHVQEVAKKIKELGVFIHNIIPLMSRPEYGTKFSNDGVPEPTPELIGKVRFQCAEVMGGFDAVMQHCRQCRADAIGKLGQDWDFNSVEDEVREKSNLMKYQVINNRRYDFSVQLNSEWKVRTYDRSRHILVAVASDNHRMADISFKNARNFYVYEVSGWGAHLREIRTLDYDNSQACIKLSGHLKNVAELIGDCAVMVCTVVGRSAYDGMHAKGIAVDTRQAYKGIEEAAWEAGSRILSDTGCTMTA